MVRCLALPRAALWRGLRRVGASVRRRPATQGLPRRGLARSGGPLGCRPRWGTACSQLGWAFTPVGWHCTGPVRLRGGRLGLPRPAAPLVERNCFAQVGVREVFAPISNGRDRSEPTGAPDVRLWPVNSRLVARTSPTRTVSSGCPRLRSTFFESSASHSKFSPSSGVRKVFAPSSCGGMGP